MATTITALDISETYSALTVLTQAELNATMESIETYSNTQLRLNLVQLAKDAFSDSYAFNDDGDQTEATDLKTAAVLLADDETVTGDWTFEGTVDLADKLVTTSTCTSTGQTKCRVYLTTANQTIANTTLTAIRYAAETYDTGVMHDTSTNPDRITIPAGAGGLYIFNAQVTFAADATGYREVHIYKNGSAMATVKEFNPHATELTIINISMQENASAADYFEVKVYQSSGGDLAVNKNERVTFFSTIKAW